MATPPASYVPWRRVKSAIAGWALSALGFDPDTDYAPGDTPVLWADQDEQRPDLPYLELLVVGFARRGQDHQRPPETVLATQVVQVLPAAVAAAGDALRVRVNGETFERLAEAGDAVGDARDALLALLEASVEIGATAASSGADSVLLTAERVGSLRVDALVGCDLGASTSTLAELRVGKREVRVRATCYGAPDGAASAPSPTEWVDLLIGGTQDPDLLEALRGQGLVPTRVSLPTARPTAQSGPERENRASVEIAFALSTTYGRALPNYLGTVDVAYVPADPDA